MTQGPVKAGQQRKVGNTNEQESEGKKMGEGRTQFFFHLPPRISSCRLSQKRKEMRKVPFDSDHLVHFLISHHSKDFF